MRMKTVDPSSHVQDARTGIYRDDQIQGFVGKVEAKKRGFVSGEIQKGIFITA